EAVARFRLDRRHPVAEHLVEPAPAVRQQVVDRGGPRRGDGRQDAAPGLEDLEIARATVALLPLRLARAREQQMRVRVDQPGSDAAAGGVEPGEPAQRITAVLERGLER